MVCALSSPPAAYVRRCCVLVAFLVAPSWAAAIERPVSLDNGRYRIPGILAEPASCSAERACAGLVLLHGTGSSKNEVNGLYAQLAARLDQVGIASLRIDLAGTGDSSVDYREYSLSGARRDAVVAKNFLKQLPGIDPQRIGVVGSSQGGLIAQLVAAQEPDIRAVLTFSSVAGDGIGIFQPFFDQYDARAQAEGYAVVQFPWRGPLNFSREWFDEVRAQTALSDMAHYHGALLAIAGIEDDVVPYTSSIRLAEAAGSADATVVLIKGADHIFHVFEPEKSRADEALSVATGWLQRKLAP